jgi:GT2 family glycosyltransferase/glycosyltransferase involved in cell wall biosynthesis
MNQKTEAVDIIIPVYNGYEDLQRCIPSVIRHTDLTKHRLVLIDDCSPDPRIAPYLDTLGSGQILVLHNEKNLGFSGNVNKGMTLSKDRDVLLLNSDTIVTAGWLDKITACARREDSIGTVTPLSNSATLCSVPVICQDNPVPEPFTIDEYAALIERCSLHRYPEITVAVGFCMFIKRCVIEDVGLFDAATFGRGYGEENDFCNRALQLGYHHVLCDDTFVYHKGTASFDTEEKQALLREHESILLQRYPEQMERNHLYCLENPDQEIRDNINLYTKLQNGKKNLLYLIHLDFRERAMSNIGGTQIHVKELMGGLREEYNIFVAARDGAYLCVTAYTQEEEILLKFEIGEPPQYPVFRDQKLRRIYEQILRAFSIDLVHIHHTQDLSLELYHAADALGIPVIATLHDYYYACPTILLLDQEQQFCQVQNSVLTETEQRERCQACLWNKKKIAPQTDYLAIWRRAHHEALRCCRELIFPSGAARDIMLDYYPDLKEKCRVIEHGEDKQERKVVHVKAPSGAVKHPHLKVKLDHVARTGQGLNDIKGWAYLEGIDNEETRLYVQLIDGKGGEDCFLVTKAARPDIVDAYGDPKALMCGIDLRVQSEKLSDGPVKIHVYVEHGAKIYTTGETFRGVYRRRFGAPDRLNVAFLGGMVPQKGSQMARAMIPMDRTEINWFIFGDIGDTSLLEMEQDNCFFSGKYKKEELPQLMKDNQIDVVCILPTWPETFCYTVSEAWMNGIPVLGTDIGAVGERIRRTGGGWLTAPDAAPEQILKQLHEIREHPDDYRQKKQIVEAMQHKSVEAMCGEYRALYETFLKTEDTSCRASDREGIDFDFIFQGLALGNPAIGGKDGIARLNRLKNENAALKAYIEVMKGTSSYRLARKIAEANVPLKEPLKKLARKLRRN